MTGLFQNEPSNPSDGKTALTVALYQTVSYSHQGTDYEFRYIPAGQGNLLEVSSGGQTQNFAAVAGATYTSGTLKVTITFADDRVINLQVTA